MSAPSSLGKRQELNRVKCTKRDKRINTHLSDCRWNNSSRIGAHKYAMFSLNRTTYRASSGWMFSLELGPANDADVKTKMTYWRTKFAIVSRRCSTAIQLTCGTMGVFRFVTSQIWLSIMQVKRVVVALINAKICEKIRNHTGFNACACNYSHCRLAELLRDVDVCVFSCVQCLSVSSIRKRNPSDMSLPLTS